MAVLSEDHCCPYNQVACECFKYGDKCYLKTSFDGLYYDFLGESIKETLLKALREKEGIKNGKR